MKDKIVLFLMAPFIMLVVCSILVICSVPLLIAIDSGSNLVVILTVFGYMFIGGAILAMKDGERYGRPMRRKK